MLALTNTIQAGAPVPLQATLKSKPVDDAGDAASAETVINIHYAHIGRATVEHGQQCSESAEA